MSINGPHKMNVVERQAAYLVHQSPNWHVVVSTILELLLGVEELDFDNACALKDLSK